ncbi:MAG: site-specific tyrosine recombinase XerD [Marinilabiliaceae bacterium]|nr:site-specific tyrosine recombinase XerD [Marinilabiliaceae bacterium]
MNWEIEIKEFKNYLKFEKGLSDNSILAYISDLEKLEHFLIDSGYEITPMEVKLTHLKELLFNINDVGLHILSQARIISGIKAFFKFLMIEGKISEDPSTLLEAPKIGRKLPDVLSIDEIDTLINAIDLNKAEGQRNKAIIETLFGCGIRVSELINIKISNMFLDMGFIKVEGKGNKERFVPIGEKAINEINIYLKKKRNTLNINKIDEDILFLNCRGKKLTRVMIFTIIKDLMKKVNIHKNISPHTFRHSFATHLIDGGANLRAVQEMLGHESITTTEIYTHLNREYLKNTIIQYHPRS